MKKILFFAATAMLFAACTNDEVKTPQVAEEAPQAVTFDIYTAGATRGGGYGIQTTSTLMEDEKGFGVFAQYSNDGDYSAGYGYNFMYNEHVKYTTAGGWTYTPLKYWPNETQKDSQTGAATSTAIDKLSFFAYAPYVIASPSTDEGIIAIAASDATSDPNVTYLVSPKPSKSVDLLWGVAPAGGLDYKTVNPDYEHTTVSGKVEEGLPLLNLLKPDKDQKIKFLFEHALARLGMTIVAAVDQIAPGGTLDDKTKIFVESVKIEETTATKVLATKGVLNLNNTTAHTARWTVWGGSEGFTATVNAANELNSDLQWDTDAATSWSKTGVTTSEDDVIADKKYFMLIPTHQDAELTVTITYYVCTKDEKLTDNYATTKNVITKAVTISKLTNNKAYNLKLVLGMTSVKLDAEVADWKVDGSAEVNLPRNNE